MKKQENVENKAVMPATENKAPEQVWVQMLKGTFKGRNLLLNRSDAERFVAHGNAEYVKDDGGHNV